MINILRSYEQATTSINVVKAFNQVGIHFDFVDPNNSDRRACYVDPSTARVVVDHFGVIPLPEELRVEPAAPRLLKISDLNSRHQSTMARELRQELADIRAELPPWSWRGLTRRPN